MAGQQDIHTFQAHAHLVALIFPVKGLCRFASGRIAFEAAMIADDNRIRVFGFANMRNPFPGGGQCVFEG
jgi:hypothetical protein